MDLKAKRSQKCHWRIKWPTTSNDHKTSDFRTFRRLFIYVWKMFAIFVRSFRHRDNFMKKKRETKFTVSKIRSQKIWILKAMNKKSTAFADIHISRKIHSTRWREYTITRCLIHKEDCICCIACPVQLTDWIEYIRSKREENKKALLNKLNKFWKQTLSCSH